MECFLINPITKNKRGKKNLDYTKTNVHPKIWSKMTKEIQNMNVNTTKKTYRKATNNKRIH